ncbi:UDP-N-acetylmuramoyl-L-alanyl-D-glutamate--2,6-diaminopimelate ligase [Sporolactobacillus inulinus]|jgi:UDP-N-acetylmuramoyl-L-alanyl-D-glutamate--2,6-diaminopimelate ligase|uniref:UDP-N-acetylmuramoyl-L-alanyl-D-glutamate--2,6-diaminopimelate ligase n=2 Tax=Sporolactobacillus inulinus TaxID=2078 RepID=A0A0U1QLW6_9BACL|nr:UDP-N-acetylmuramoyl-L-alanyl-D-glutamate--2,6-diaminopimelate ligase [Sporolactobacillus inulinus]KLI01773.1 UDP-N-acetylmuramoylalanyl-D-glutamate--2,6-diaminopimelate ligase [Sporolactobacillus inulinus CASD]GEB76442.1 UDP-N-acetylmuramoyl-L-alanyl-D-glutamate--2,6-diaminopimelate ligase [Sporolactobacillus inulinus]
MKLSDCLKALDIFRQEGAGNPEIDDLMIDSRLVKPGSLFFCIKGHHIDGHRFARQAQASGASAIVAQDAVDVSIPVIRVNDTHRALAMISDYFYGHPSHELFLLGVTGTNGKTTITYLVQAIQEAAGINTGLIGTMGMHYKNKSIPVQNTTPEVHLIHQNLAEMKAEGAASVVMEASSNALYDGRLHGCAFNVGIFTNLTEDHLDLHGTMKDYMYAKSLLFSQLGNCYGTGQKKAAVLNVDDPASEVYKHMTASHVITYGINHSADFRAKAIKINPSGTEFVLENAGHSYPVSMKLIGKFSVYNVLAALAACSVSGIALEAMIHTVEQIKGVAGRFEPVDAGQDFTVIVDYSHTPDSLENALSTIKEFARKRVITIAGCGGDRERGKRPIMAKIAVDNSDLAILTADNPRTEDPEQILLEMEAGVTGRDYRKIPDRREAIRYAVDEAESGDILLIAGKGHEDYQIIGTTKHHFDDREEARKAIRARMNRTN